jgi:hypothetical protein
VGVRVEVGGEAIGLEAELAGVAEQVFAGECPLPVEQKVVELPEAALGMGRLSRFRALLRVRVDVTQREVAEYEAKQIRSIALELLDGAVGEPGIRALVVAVKDQGWRRLRAAGVIDRAQSAPPAGSGAIGSAPPAPPGFSRAMNSSRVIGKSRTRSATSSSSVIVATSSTCSLRNHCTNCSLR